MPDHHLDLSSDPAGSRQQPLSSARRFVGVNFACCGVYSRVYINREETAYVGNCPKCGRCVTLKIGPDGSESRFFTAY